MARAGQIEFIDDLLRKVDLTAERMADLAGESSWQDYDRLPPVEASECIEWIQEYSRRSRTRGTR